VIILAWLAAAVLLSAGMIGAANGLYWLVKCFRSRKWPTVPGKIVTSEVATETEITCGEFGDPQVISRDSPKIRYSYAVGGREFMSARIRWVSRKWGVTDPARRTVAKYPVDQPVSVYYDPNRLANAVLEPVAEGLLVRGLLTVAFDFRGSAARVYVRRCDLSRSWQPNCRRADQGLTGHGNVTTARALHIGQRLHWPCRGDPCGRPV